MKFDFHTLTFNETEREPGKLAVAGSDRDLSWSEFAAQVDALSQLLATTGIPAGHPVMICGHKEAMFAVSIMACVKIGIPYIPVDHSFPDGRVQKIKETSGSEVMICTGGWEPSVECAVIIDRDKVVTKTPGSVLQPVLKRKDDPVCYVMFTSGSTGEPKGVMITLNAVRSFVNWMHHDYPIDASTVFMNQAAFTFDISLIDLYGGCSLGASIVLNSSEIAKQPGALFDRIRKYNCTFWNSTPSFVFLCMSHPEFNAASLQSMKDFILLGEVLPSRTVTKIHTLFPASRVYNAYGPTEATVATTIIQITPDVIATSGADLPIGYAKDGDSIKVINDSGDESEEGELIIVGEHVGIGYAGRPELTKERFGMLDGKRSYKTGDFGFIRNGIVYFNGRKDDQVKLHGYRIETGEISAVLSACEGVADAVTLPLKSGGQVRKIISFVRIKPGSNVSTGEIITWAKNKMPGYMVPSDIRVIDEFPVNTNHKIDLRRLQEIYISGK